MSPSIIESVNDFSAFSSKKPETQPDVAKRPEATQVQSLGRAKDGRMLKVREYPKFETLEEERLYRKQHLAAAFRIFADRGFDEGIAGHISVRDPILTDHFWLNPLSMHFSLIKVSDLILVDEEGFVVEGDEPINTAAFTIHSATHKARPEVNAACHAHSVHGKAFACFGRKLEMLTQDSLRFYKDHAVYENFGGVVLDAEEGQRIVESLGTCKAIILQNHGVLTVVEVSMRQPSGLDKTCQVQLLADAAPTAGYKKILIDDEEAEYSRTNVGGPDKGWLAFQPYYDEQVAKTRGSFLN